jgi:hypothetical protein
LSLELSSRSRYLGQVGDCAAGLFLRLTSEIKATSVSLTPPSPSQSGQKSAPFDIAPFWLSSARLRRDRRHAEQGNRNTALSVEDMNTPTTLVVSSIRILDRVVVMFFPACSLPAPGSESRRV